MDIEKFIRFRKELHKIPEEAFKEDKTRAFIKNALNGVNGLELLEDKSYLLYRYFKGEDKKSIVLRCDMDSIVNSKKDTLSRLRSRWTHGDNAWHYTFNGYG